MKIYSFDYCSSIYESGYVTMSLHKTRQGAYKAMKEYLINDYLQWYNIRIKYGKYPGDKWNIHSAWCINEFDVLD